MTDQECINDLRGYDKVAAFLVGRWGYLKGLNEPTGRAVLGEVDLPDGSDYPCAIFYLDTEPLTLMVLKLNTRAKVSNVDILSVAPHPRMARVIQECPPKAEASPSNSLT